MALPRRGGGSRLTLALLVLVSLTLVTLDYQGFGPIDSVKDGFNDLISPVRDGLADLTSPISDAWHGITDYGNVRDSNEELTDRVAELEGELARIEADAGSYQDLLAESGLEYVEYPTVVARVVSTGVGNFAVHIIEIDKGRDAGIRVGMAVATSAGLIGRIVEVTGSRSVVQLVSDPEMRWGVRLSASQDIAIGHGIGDDGEIEVDEGVDDDTRVAEDEVVVTSGGRSSFFPPDIPVGRVSVIQDPEGEVDRVVRVTLLADLEDLTFVNVVLFEAEDPTPEIDPGQLETDAERNQGTG